MKTAVTVLVVFMTSVCNVHTDNNTIHGKTENATAINATETEPQMSEIVQNKDLKVSVKIHGEENQKHSDRKGPTYSSAQGIAKKNLYLLVKIRLLGHLLQSLPIEKRQSILINALKKVDNSGEENGGQNGISKAFSMQHRSYEDSNENGSGSQESTEKVADKGQEKVFVSDNRNQESYDQETELQLQVLKNQVSNDVKNLLKTVFPRVDSNSQSATQGLYPHTTNNNQHSRDSILSSKELNNKYTSPVVLNVINPEQKKSTQPVNVLNSFVPRSPYSDDHPLKQVKINDLRTRPSLVLPPSTTPFTIYQGPSLEVNPYHEILNLQPVTLKDSSAEMPSVNFLGEHKHDEFFKPDARDTGANRELFGLSKSYDNDHSTQSKNAQIVENDFQNSSEEKSVDNNDYHMTSNLQNFKVYPSSDVQDYYEDHFLTSDKNNVEEAVKMIYNLFNDYDDHVYDYENEKLNFDVELHPTTTQSPSVSHKGYSFNATKSSFSASHDIPAENMSTSDEDKNGNNIKEIVAKHEMTHTPRIGSGIIYPTNQMKTGVQKERRDEPSSDNSRSQEMEESEVESVDNHFDVVEDYKGKDITHMYNTKETEKNKAPGSSSSTVEITSSNVVRRYQSPFISNGSTNSKEIVKQSENNEQFSSEMEASLHSQTRKNIFPLSRYDANIKKSEYEKTIIKDRGMHNSRQHLDSESKESWSSEDEMTLYNLLEKPFFSHSQYGVSKKDTLDDERKFGFDSEEEYGRNGGDSSKDDSYDFILQENHILKQRQPQHSSRMVSAKYSNSEENNSQLQHKFSLSNELTTSGSSDVNFGENILRFDKGNGVSKEDSEEKLSAPGHQTENSSQEKDSSHVLEKAHENKILKETVSSVSHINALFPLQVKNNQYDGYVSSSESEGSNSATKEDNNSPSENLIVEDKRNEHSSEESRSSLQEEIDEYEMKQLLRELDRNLNNVVKVSKNYKPWHTSKDLGNSEELSLRTVSLGKDSSFEHDLMSSSQSTENMSDSLWKEGNTIGNGNTVKVINSADSTENNKQYNVNGHYQSSDGEKIQNRNSNEGTIIFESQSHENDHSFDMHAIETKKLLNGVGNIKDVSSSSKEQTDAIKKDESKSIEKFKNYEILENASKDKQGESTESQSTNYFEDSSIENVLRNKSDGFDSTEIENVSSKGHASLDTGSSSGNIDFKFTNYKRMFAETNDDASENYENESSSVGSEENKNRVENKMDSSGISQEELVDDSIDEGNISLQINKRFDEDSSLESNSVSEDEDNNNSLSTEFKNHVSSEENALSSDSSVKDYAILNDKTDKSLSGGNNYNLPGDKSSSCEEKYCKSSSTDKDFLDKSKSSENESFEQNIPINKEYLPQDKNIESYQTVTSTSENSSEESSEKESNEYVFNNDDDKESDESRQESTLFGSEENISNDSEESNNENPNYRSTESTENYSAEVPVESRSSSEEKKEEIKLQYIVEKVSGNEKKGQESDDVDDSEQAKNENPKYRSTESTENYRADIPEESRSSSEEKKEETKLQYIVEKVSGHDKKGQESGGVDDSGQVKNDNLEYSSSESTENHSSEIPNEPNPPSEEKEKTKLQYIVEKVSGHEKKGQESGDVDDSEQAKNDNLKYSRSESSENHSSEIPNEPNPPSEEKKEETKLQYNVEKVSGHEKKGQESGDVDKSENKQSHEYSKLIVEKTVFDANIDGGDNSNGSESREETTQRITESIENGNDYKSEEQDKIKVENNGNSQENKDEQSDEILYEEPKTDHNHEQKHESIEKNVKKHDTNGNSEENYHQKDDPAEENKKNENKNEYEQDKKQKDKPNCDKKTNEKNTNVDDDIMTKEIRDDNDLEKAVEMISDMFVFDFNGLNNQKHVDYESEKNYNTDSGYGKVGRVKSLIQKLIHLKKLWWKTKNGSIKSKSSSGSVYGSGDTSKLNMKLPTLKNNLYEKSNRRSFYGKKIHSNFGSVITYGSRQPYRQPSFLPPSKYGSRDSYNRRPSAPYRSTLSKYPRGIYSPLFSDSRYARPSYASRKLKISFGDSSNDYGESQAGLSRLSGILTKKPRTGVYGSRIGYDDSMYSRDENIHDINAHIFDSVSDHTNNDEDVIVHPVVTKSSY